MLMLTEHQALSEEELERHRNTAQLSQETEEDAEMAEMHEVWPP